MIEENKDCWLLDDCNHIDCDRYCMRKEKLKYLYDKANITLKQRKRIPLYLDASQVDYSPFMQLKSIEDNILDFITNGKNLYIFSAITGNGKTAWSLRLIQDYFNLIWAKAVVPGECRGLFIHTPSFLLELKDDILVKSERIKELKNNLLSCDVVIWDEIGTKYTTPFEMENLLSVIDCRLRNNKSNIYTSNLTKGELLDKVGERLYSRIINNSMCIEFKGQDKRYLFK